MKALCGVLLFRILYSMLPILYWLKEGAHHEVFLDRRFVTILHSMGTRDNIFKD